MLSHPASLRMQKDAIKAITCEHVARISIHLVLIGNAHARPIKSLSIIQRVFIKIYVVWDVTMFKKTIENKHIYRTRVDSKQDWT